MQVKRCADAGADIVRITVQGTKEAEACGKIRDKLFQQGCVAWRTSSSHLHVLQIAVLPVLPMLFAASQLCSAKWLCVGWCSYHIATASCCFQSCRQRWTILWA